MNKQFIDENREAFEYIYELQKSGATNMFGAEPYLIRGAGCNKQTARVVLLEYMKNYQEIKDYLGIED